jgi:peroxiredoxin
MELEALETINSEVRALGARIVVLTPELERYTRALHKKPNLSFDILTDLHLKTAEQFRLVFPLPDYLRDLYKSFGSTLDRFTTSRNTDCRCLRATWSIRKGSFVGLM